MPLPRIIPPRSVVTLVRCDSDTPAWRKDVGRQFRIGYYRKRAGLDVIWLVNELGEYEQTTDHETLLKYFVVDKLSPERSLYGIDRPQLGRVKRVSLAKT